MARTLFRWLPVCLATAAVVLAPAEAALGQAQRDCTVPRERGGLIRGDRIPAGCLLRRQEPRRPTATETSPWPFIPCNVLLFYLPNPKGVALLNCLRLSRGRPLIPTVGTEREVEAQALQSQERRFGPLERRFGPLERRFGPLERRFGPLKRPFGPLERPFGPLKRRFGPVERPSGSAHPSGGNR